MSTFISGIASGIGNIAGGLISNGFNTKAGTLLNKAGDVASMIPGPWGAVASVGLKAIGGLTNAAFGVKTNQKALNAANQGTDYLKTFTSTASSFDDIQGPLAVANVQNAYKGGWLKKKSARRKNNALREARAYAEDYAARSVENNIDNIKQTQYDNMLANYASFGGDLNFGNGALGYGLMNSWLDSQNNKALGMDKTLTALPNSFDRIDTFSFGGELNTNGSDFTNGLIYIDNGGSHENNPNEGVPMGTDINGIPNLVEEGETVFNDYVFSDRLNVPKSIRNKYKLRDNKKISFAEASKKLSKESEERPNDPISQRGLEVIMSDLAMEQEAVRSRKNNKKYKNNKFSGGGWKDIDDELVEITNPYYQGFNTFDYDLNSIPTPTSTGTSASGVKGYNTSLRYAPVVGLGVASITDALGITNKPNYSNADATIELGKYVAPKKVTWSPSGDYLKYEPLDRNYYINKLNASTGATRRSIMNTAGANRAQAIAGLLAADYNANMQLGNLARQAEEYNLAQRQQVKGFNRETNLANAEGIMKAASANQAADIKARAMGLEAQMRGYQMREAARLAAEEAKSANLSGFLTSLGNIGKENVARNYKKFAMLSGQYGPISPELMYLLDV